MKAAWYERNGAARDVLVVGEMSKPLPGPGEVLVIGAASAVGHYAAQIVVMRGARVIGTASAERADHARAAGVAHVIDYRSEDVAARVLNLTDGRGTDFIVDMDFSTTADLLSILTILAPKGKLICYGSNVPGANTVPFGELLFKSLTLQFFLVYELSNSERAATIEAIGSMLEAGALTHIIGARFSLDEIASAHEAVEAGRILGNVVIDRVP